MYTDKRQWMLCSVVGKLESFQSIRSFTTWKADRVYIRAAAQMAKQREARSNVTKERCRKTDNKKKKQCLVLS